MAVASQESDENVINCNKAMSRSINPASGMELL